MIIKNCKLDSEFTLTFEGELIEDEAVIDKQALIYLEIEKAFEMGKKEGESQGYDKARSESQSLCQLLHTLADKLMQHRKQLLIQVKPEVIELAFDIAEKLIRQELSQTKTLMQFIHALVMQAIGAFAGTPIKIFLNPENMLEIEPMLDSIQSQMRTKLEFCADPKLTMGDCRIQSDVGILNAEIKKQLDHMKSRLL